jgi:hypothetical protein
MIFDKAGNCIGGTQLRHAWKFRNERGIKRAAIHAGLSARNDLLECHWAFTA